MPRIIPVYFLGIVSLFCVFGQLQIGNDPKKMDAALWDAQAVVVGDLLSGQAAEANRNVTVTAVLRVRRSLSGPLEPGAEIQIAWDYQTRGVWPAADTQTVRPVSGIWMLSRNGANWAPQPMTLSVPGAIGGVYLPCAPGPLPAEAYYPPDAALDEKFAQELGAGLAAAAATAGGQLRIEPLGPGMGFRMKQPAMQFKQWAEWLWRLRPDAALPVFRRFATAQEPNLKMIGLSGLVAQNDAGALTAIEQNLPDLAVTVEADRLGKSLKPDFLRKNPASIHILGRLILAETPLPNLDALAGRWMSMSGHVEALPYLIAILDHPDHNIRSNDVLMVCDLVRTVPMPAGQTPLWDLPSMSAQCPSHTPLQDTEEVARQVRFWKDWYAAHREQLLQWPGVQEPRAPSWYLTAARTVPLPVSMEQRFQFLVAQYSNWEKRQAEQPVAAASVLPGLALNDRDAEAFRSILKDAAAKMKAWQQQIADLKDAARRSGQPLDRAATAAWAANGKSIATAALEEARRTLSSDGWMAVERRLNDMGVSSGTVPANRAPGSN